MSNREILKNKFSTGKKPTGDDFSSLIDEASDGLELAEQLADGEIQSGILRTKIDDKLNDLEVEYAPELTNVKQQLADKANQEELGIERARISNLTAHAGDTDGNAELLDIRVGFDGVTYATAGEATRALGNYMTDENQYWSVD